MNSDGDKVIFAKNVYSHLCTFFILLSKKNIDKMSKILYNTYV